MRYIIGHGKNIQCRIRVFIEQLLAVIAERQAGIRRFGFTTEESEVVSQRKIKAVARRRALNLERPMVVGETPTTANVKTAEILLLERD